MAKREIFSVENGKIIKNGNIALEDLSLHIFEDEITGIVFDSILDQQVFLSFLTGDIIPESGNFYIYGKQKTSDKLSKLLPSMVAIVGMKSKLIPSITIADNIFLFTDNNVFFSEKTYRRKLETLWSQFEISDEIPRKVRDLTIKQKVIIELLKAYVEKKKIVVLDGIAGIFSEKDMEEIFTLVYKMKEKMSFLVTVGFEETVVKHSDVLIIVQNGKTTYMGQTKVLNKKLNEILKILLLGRADREEKLKKYQSIAKKKEKHIFTIVNGSTSYLQDISFSLSTGELLKVYCVDEESKRHLWEMIAGEISLTGGNMFLEDIEFRPKSMNQSVKRGVGFIPETPYRTMMLENMSVLENLSIPLDKKIIGFWWYKKYVESVWKLFPQVRSRREKIRDMDNSQLQHLVYEKWSLYLPKLIVIENPFSDMDVNMREITVNMINNLQQKGIAIIILTSNFTTMKEIQGKSIYLKKGRIREKWQI